MTEPGSRRAAAAVIGGEVAWPGADEGGHVATSPIWASRPKTRGLVLDVIRAARASSRVELAAVTGLTGATISEVVRELIADGLVVEAGRGAPTGRKPRTLV